jgi:hypothetical protein
MNKVQVPSNPGRLINAVASIGYDPEVALTDLMDNSLDARAGTITVHLIPESHEEEGDTDTIHQYAIADDGVGMDEETLIRAFTLGTQRDYPPHSLGKFGLGLKAAGLSVAHRIAIVTKTERKAKPVCAILSLDEVEQSGKYEIDLGDPPDDLAQLWEELRVNDQQGTLLVLRELNENQPAFATFLEYFRRYSSLTYHLFMEDPDPLSIIVNGQKLTPLDPLFMKEASANGPLSADAWDGRTVHVLLEPTNVDLDGNATCSIAATHLVHPPSFEAEGKRDEVRNKYGIESDPYTHRPRHGFYVYRNRRIIVMAERFHGLVPAQVQAWAFRARLMFDESADDILSLDVKKRHCQLPKRARNNLKALISTYQAKSAEAWRTAGRREKERKKDTREDIANRSIADTPVADLDYAPGVDLSSKAAIATRKELQEAVGRETLDAIQDPSISSDTLEARASEKSIVTSVQGLKGNAMWLPYPAVQLGRAETLVNRAHSWVAEAYAAADKEPGIAIVLHQLFTILARAELEVRSTDWKDASPDLAAKVLERFRKRASMIGEDLADQLAQALAEESPTGEELE